MQIIDTYQDILDIFLNENFSFAIWEKYAYSISNSLVKKIEKDSSKYDFNTEILPVISQMLQKKDKLEEAHSAFVNVTESLSTRIFDVFGINLDVAIIFYLGLCNGAGWATSIDGKPTVLLGIEKIIELNWCDERNMIGLIYHELGHIWHNHIRTVPTTFESQKDRALWQMYSEGIAMYCEQLLYGDIKFYHQDVNGWLSWCQNNQNHLFSEYKRRVEANESVQPFFGDWCQFEGHSDIGYYLGAKFVEKLAEERSLFELANLDMTTIEGKLDLMIY